MNKLTLQQLHEQFIYESKFSGRLSTATIKGYADSFKLLLKIFPDLRPNDLTPEKMTAYFQILDTRDRPVGRNSTKTGVKATTIATYHAKLSPFFEWLKNKGCIIRNPLKEMKKPHVFYDAPQYLKKENLDKILIAVEININWPNRFLRKRNSAIMAIMLHCGLRAGEVLSLKVLNLDMDRKTIMIDASGSKARITKMIPLNQYVHRHLEDYMEERVKRGYMNPFLFASDNKDQELTYVGFRKLISRINKESGIKFHAHQLRHTFAVNLLAQKSDLTTIQKLLGHRNIGSTMTYLRTIPDGAMVNSVNCLNPANFI